MCDMFRVLMRCAKLWITRVDWQQFTIDLTETEFENICSV